jgi:AraC family transcriptional regulator
VTLRSLAETAGLSPYHFARQFKQSTGLAPRQYVIHRRVERAKSMLVHSNRSISDVAVEVGFCDQSHFAAHFRRVYGLSPKAFLQQIATSTRAG